MKKLIAMLILLSTLPVFAYNRAGSLQRQLDKQIIAARLASAEGDLLAAVKRGNTEEIRELLLQGADPNEPDENGHTAFMLAIRPGGTEIFEAVFTGYDDYLETVHKEQEGDWKAKNFAVLLRSMSQTDEKGRTLLMLAAQTGDVELIWTVLYFYYYLVNKSSADKFREALRKYVNAQDNAGTTALMYAAQSGSEEAVNELFALKIYNENGDEVSRIPTGVSSSLTDNEQRKAADYAREKGYINLAGFLEGLRDGGQICCSKQ